MSIGRASEGTGLMSPDSDAEASEPAAQPAAVVEGVNVAPRERVMPSIESLNARNAAERSAAEKRERGETPMGNLEVIAKEADARAQEVLVAQTTGFFNRVKNAAGKAWTAISSFASFLKTDLVLPMYDALADLATGRKESGELVGESMAKIDSLQKQISLSGGAERDALEKQLADEQDHLANLRDPHNAARDMAAREKAAAAAQKAEAAVFMKSEAERIAAENLAAAVAKAQEAHAAKLEKERLERESRANLGRGTVILLSKLVDADPAQSGLTESQIVAIGTVIDGAKKGIIGAINLPDRVKTGLRDYKDGEVAKAREAYQMTKDALDDMTLGEDRRELWAFTKGALSFTGAVLRNADVKQEVLDILGQEQELDADGKTVIKNRGTADVLANAIKDGTVDSFKAMGSAVADAARDIRDSEAVATAKRGVKNTAKVAAAGAGGYAAGTAGVVAAPFVFAAAPYMLGAAAGGAAVYGTYRAGKKGYEVASAAATRQLEKMTPGIVDTIVPMIEAVADLDEMARNLPDNTRMALKKVGGEINDALLAGADSINEKTRRGIAFYRDMKARLGRLSEVAQLAYNKLEREALAEAARAQNPALAANVDAAIDARAAVDAEAAAATVEVASTEATVSDQGDAPTPSVPPRVKAGGVVPVKRTYGKLSA